MPDGTFTICAAQSPAAWAALYHPSAIEKVLNHVSGSFAWTAGIYQRHEFAEEKRAALEKWADHVERLVR